MTARRQTDLQLFRRLSRQVGPYWLHLAGVFLLSVLSTPLRLLTPLPLKLAFDNLIGDRPVTGALRTFLPGRFEHSTAGLLIFTIVTLVAITALVQLQALGSWLLETYAGERLLLDFRGLLFRHLQRLSIAYHDSKGTADSIYRIQYDAPSIQYITVNGVIPLISAVLTLGAMFYVTARIDLKLALIALGISPLLFLLTRIYGQHLRDKWKTVKKLDSSAMSVAQEVLSAVRVVKAFGKEDHESDRFIEYSNRRLSEQMRLVLMQGGFDLLVGLTIAGGAAATLLMGVLHVRAGALTIGSLLVVMAYQAQLYEPLKTLSKKVADLQSGFASAERAFALMDELPEVLERPHARPLARAAGRVTFYNVQFSYDDTRPILRDISFEAEPGARVGIQGATGAGKTTLTNLLMRFYDPAAGQILLDGVDLRDYKLADLRNQFAMVLQEPVLFSTSIAENIAYAQPQATEEEIVAAAKAANVHDFISNLPDGYQTRVGERGMRLSGGERQRISLARAFLKDAPILLLDEPTSSIDTRTEAGIMETMERLMRGRTTFMIAHRLTTLRDCDLRLEIENGRLFVLSGTTENVEGKAALA